MIDVFVEILAGSTPESRITVRFSNRSDRPIRLIAELSSEETVGARDLFEFEPPAAYIGMLVKRTPYEDDDLIILEPGTQVESPEIDLADSYDLSDRAPFAVRYAHKHPLLGVDGPLFEVASEFVKLGLTEHAGPISHRETSIKAWLRDHWRRDKPTSTEV